MCFLAYLVLDHTWSIGVAVYSVIHVGAVMWWSTEELDIMSTKAPSLLWGISKFIFNSPPMTIVSLFEIFVGRTSIFEVNRVSLLGWGRGYNAVVFFCNLIWTSPTFSDRLSIICFCYRVLFFRKTESKPLYFPQKALFPKEWSGLMQHLTRKYKMRNVIKIS